MGPRRKTLPADTPSSQVGTPLRQMTITESFKNSKPKLFKMEKPFFVTNVCHVIDSDSDAETPPQFEFEDAPSPPKTRRIIGVFKPGSSTSPKKPISPATPTRLGIDSPSTLNAASPHSFVSNSSSNTIGYDYSLNSSLNSACWDEDTVPFSLNTKCAQPKMISSEEVLHMNYEENASDVFPSPRQYNSESRSSIIFSTNAQKVSAAKRLDFKASADNSNAPIKKERKKRAPRKNKPTDSVQQNQNGDGTSNANIPPKKRRGRKRKSEAESNNNDQKNSDQNLSAPDEAAIKDVHSVKERKRKNNVKSNNDNKKKLCAFQKNPLANQNLSATGMAVAKNTQAAKPRKRKVGIETNNTKNDSIIRVDPPHHHDLASNTKELVVINVPSMIITPFRSSAKQAGSVEQESSMHDNSTPTFTQNSCRDNMVMTPAGTSAKLFTIPAQTVRKGSPNDVTKQKVNLAGIIDKIRANNELSVNLVEVERNDVNTQNVHHKNVDNLGRNKTASMLPATGWISRATIVSNPNTPSKRRYSKVTGANITPQNITLNQALGRTSSKSKPDNIAEIHSKPTIESKTNASNKVIQVVGVEKSQQKDTPRKTGVDNLHPMCSKSSTQENSCTTLEKQIHDGVENNQQKDPPRKTVVVDDQRPVCSKSLTKESSSTTLDKQSHNGVEKNQHKVTPSKTVVDDQRPMCSKSLTKDNSYTTPKKQKMGPNTPSKNTSPKRKLFGSPNKNSPVKYREIKTLKSKEGKQLQVKQMDELVKLFHMVDSNRHLKTLLNSKEREILRKFLTMEDNKRYFLMKLFVWKRQWYSIFPFCNKAKIEYDDKKDITDIFQYLCEEQLVDSEYTNSSNLLELLNTLDRVMVKEIMKEKGIKPIKSKAENIKTLLAAAGRQATLTSKTFKDLIMESIKKKMGFAMKIKEDVSNAFYNAYLLATFTNPAFYKIEDYFNNIVHLGVVFPEMHIEDYPVFHSRDKFLKYGRALKLRTELDEQLANKNKESKFMGIKNIASEAYDQLLSLDTDDTDDFSQAPHLKRFTAQHIYTGILSACCEKMYTKQNGQPSEVKKWLEYLIKKFSNSRRLAKWCGLLIVLHMRHLNRIDYETGAMMLIVLLRNENVIVGDIGKHDLGKLGRQLMSSRTYKIDQMYHDRITQLIPRIIDDQSFPQVQIDSQCIRSDESGRKRGYISKSSEGMTVRGVEQVALEHYAENGYPGGVHCEGGLIKALLMLLFWDIIYNPTKTIPGTFLSKLQIAPLDMGTPHFYRNRMELIDKRLEEIDSKWPDDKLVEFAANNWQQHVHERAAFSIDIIPDQPTVEILVNVIGRKVLAKILERLIKNLREFGSGMPDLLVWNIDKKQCKFVEVKGEGDSLSTGQKLWLQYLEQSDAAIEVCFVHSTGSKRKKLKNKAKTVDDEPQKDNEVGHTESRPED